MAKFIGTAGYFQDERAIKRRERALLALIAVLAICEFTIGYFVGSRSVFLVAVAVLFLVLMMRLFFRHFDKEIRRARIDETGASGERSIIPYLRKLPDTYTVLSDLEFADSYGNIDHLVVGPTGVFSIDVKNWKGNVAADGRGELLLNGKPTDKPQVRAFTARTMDLKQRLNAVIRLDPYIQCLFVFPHTYIEARWGTTGTVLCVDAENLVDLIIKPNPSRALKAGNVARLVDGAKALKSLVGTTPSPTPPSPTSQPSA